MRLELHLLTHILGTSVISHLIPNLDFIYLLICNVDKFATYFTRMR